MDNRKRKLVKLQGNNDSLNKHIQCKNTNALWVTVPCLLPLAAQLVLSGGFRSTQTFDLPENHQRHDSLSQKSFITPNDKQKTPRLLQELKVLLHVNHFEQ